MARERPRLSAMLPMALERLDRLAFVGLTEHWEKSIDLFHARLECGSAPLAAELHNNRAQHPTAEGYSPFSLESSQVAAQAEHSHVYDESKLGGLVDAIDEELYAAARQRFERDIAAEVASARSNATHQGRPRCPRRGARPVGAAAMVALAVAVLILACMLLSELLHLRLPSTISMDQIEIQMPLGAAIERTRTLPR